MAFAIDESGAVHWLYPGYVDPASDPAAIRLAYATVETPLAESVQLEGVSAGRLRVVVLKSTEPLTVHAIESLAPADLELEALRRRFPRALLRETDVVIDAD